MSFFLQALGRFHLRKPGNRPQVEFIHQSSFRVQIYWTMWMV